MCNNFNNSDNNIPSVICIGTPERKENYLWFKGSDKINNPKIAIETIEGLRSRGFVFPRDLAMNDLLILHPYEQNKFIHIEDVENGNIKASKFFKYKEILQDLGALSYEVKSVATKVYEVKLEAEGDVSYKKVKTPVELEVDVSKKEDFLSKMGFDLKSSFDGVRTISKQSYNHAKQLVEQYRLQDDEFINTLIKARDPDKENHQRTEHLRCESMQEFNKCVDVAVAFNAVSIFNFSANIKHAISGKVEYSLDIDVIFPEPTNENPNNE